MTGAAKATGKPRLDIDRTREQLLALGCAHAADQLGAERTSIDSNG